MVMKVLLVTEGSAESMIFTFFFFVGGVFHCYPPLKNSWMLPFIIVVT